MPPDSLVPRPRPAPPEVPDTSQLTLTAPAVEEALEERILRGVYAPGSTLPSVRVLAAELGTSPSTVSRALQGLERRGWVTVADRRGVSVASTFPRVDDPDERTEEALLSLAVRWRLLGRSADEFTALVARVVEASFRPVPPAFFVECNSVELAKVSDHIRREMGIQIEPLLVSELQSDPGRVNGSMVLTPFFHLAEVRATVGVNVQIIPLNLVPSEATMRLLSELPHETAVLAVGRDDRATQQISGLASHYAFTRVVGASLAAVTRDPGILGRSDVVVVTNATGLAPALRALAKRIIVVEFDLELSGLEALRAAVRAAEASAVS